MEKNNYSTEPLQSPRIGGAQAWMVAARPRSLPVAIGPVVVGASFGYLHAGNIDIVAALLALAAALMMQIIVNLQNDVGYTVRGGDRTGTRTGLPRATANGWLSVRQVRVAIVILSLVSVGLGIALVADRGWPVLAIGAISLMAALAYMGGPKPIAYTPFGELTVMVFFGLVAVCGTAFCWPINSAFLKGIAPILENAGTIGEPLALDLFGRAYCGWAYSAEFFRAELYRRLGFETLNALLDDWAADHQSHRAADARVPKATAKVRRPTSRSWAISR